MTFSDLCFLQLCGDQMGAVVDNTLFKMEPPVNATHRQMPIRRAHAAHHWGGVEIRWTIVNVLDAKILEVGSDSFKRIDK